MSRFWITIEIDTTANTIGCMFCHSQARNAGFFHSHHFEYPGDILKTQAFRFRDEQVGQEQTEKRDSRVEIEHTSYINGGLCLWWAARKDNGVWFDASD